MNHCAIGGIAAASLALAAAGAFAQDKVTLEFSVTEGEYAAQYQGILDLYEEENPNVEINLTSVNEDTEAAFSARVAAGDAPAARDLIWPDKNSYQQYVNLLDVDTLHWDKLIYDGQHAFENTTGIEGYQPTFNVRVGPFRGFIYYADEMEKAGLDPKSIKTVDDLIAFLDELKAYVDSNPDLEYVLDTGWLAGAWGRFNPEVWAFGLGATKEEIADVFRGKIDWTDQANNPFVPYFKTLKLFYDKGYMPERWWTRNWDQDYEAGFIAGKSILTFHGPWTWDKVHAVKPDANLDGFFFPPNKENKIWGDMLSSDWGAAMYSANRDDPNFDEMLKLFNWWNSPQIVKYRAEAVGFVPAMDLSEVGGVELTNDQYTKVIKPVLDGEVNGATFDHGMCGRCVVEEYYVGGTPRVFQDNAMAEIYGDYLEGRTDLAELLEIMKARWERAYNLPN